MSDRAAHGALARRGSSAKHAGSGTSNGGARGSDEAEIQVGDGSATFAQGDRAGGWRILICDDHAVTRHGLRLMAEAIEGVEVVGEACTGTEALSSAAELHPDLVLMDLDMPEMGGLEAIRQLKAEMPEIDALVLTVHEDEEPVFDAISAGAAGYLSKASSVDEIRSALLALRAGGAYITSSMAGKALRYVSRKADEVHQAATAVEMTTPREREILTLLGRGYSARRISTRLGISERTVNTHVGHIYRRLGVNNRVDAVREGMRLGLVEAPR